MVHGVGDGEGEVKTPRCPPLALPAPPTLTHASHRVLGVNVRPRRQKRSDHCTMTEIGSIMKRHASILHHAVPSARPSPRHFQRHIQHMPNLLRKELYFCDTHMILRNRSRRRVDGPHTYCRGRQSKVWSSQKTRTVSCCPKSSRFKGFRFSGVGLRSVCLCAWGLWLTYIKTSKGLRDHG